MLKKITTIVFLAVILLHIGSNGYEPDEEDDQLHIDRSSALVKNSLHSQIEEFLDSIQSISTTSPTWEPTEFPTLEPNNVRTESPTIVSSIFSTEFPTFSPTVDFPPSSMPTVSHQPTTSPTWESTAIPSIARTECPTTLMPSIAPSLSSQPTVYPTYMPTFTPTVAATSQEPTMAPSFQNRPIILVECNITLYNISTSSLNGDEMTAINRATALMLKVPFDRVSTARWELVGVQTTRRRKLSSSSESVDTDKSSLTAPESLWDVTAEEEDSFSRDGKTFASDDNFDSESTSSQKNSSKTPSDGESSNFQQQHKNIQTEIGVFYDSFEDLVSPSLSSNFSSPNSHNNSPEPQMSRPLLRDNTQHSKHHHAASQQQSIFFWLFARIQQLPSFVKYFSSQQQQSSLISHVPTLDATLTSEVTNYEFFYTAQVEVMMVDFPEYRSITNGTRLMNFLRQRVRSNLRTGNFSRNIQRQYQHLGYTSSTSTSSSVMAQATASRVVLRNQGLVFAPSFAPTPSPIAVKENAAVATSIAGMVVGIAAGCLAIGALLVICAARRAEHQLPPKPVELTSLLSIEEGKEEQDTATAAAARGGGKGNKTRKARKPSSSKIAAMEDDDENAMLPSALKSKPQK